MSVSLQADSTLPQGYILVDGQRVASVSTTGGLSANSINTATLQSNQTYFTRGVPISHPDFVNGTATVLVSGGVHIERGRGNVNNAGFAFIGDRDTGMFNLFPEHGLDNTLSFLTLGTERIRINETGQVIIGSSTAELTFSSFNPTFYVESGIGTMVGMGSTVASSSTTIAVGRRRTGLATVVNGDSLGKFSAFGWNGTSYNEASRIETVVDAAPGVNDMPGRLVFSTTADGASVPIERMRITSNGNVGINLTVPTAQLQVESTSEGGYCIQAQSPSESGAISLRPDGTNGNILRWGGSGALGHLLRFQRTGDNEVARFGYYTGTTTGLAIGTTSVSHQLRLGNDSAGKPGTNTWAIVSDERIKENINLASIDRCYEIVKDLPLKRFTWKNEIYSQEQVSDRSKLGWVAQDVQTVFPKGVEIKTMTFSPSGAASEITIEDCLTLNSDQIYAAMYGAIQKLINIVETQSVQISALQEQINS